MANNVHFRAQGRGRVIRFSCAPGSMLIGKRFATCVAGKWSNDPPICIAKGCLVPDLSRNSMINLLYDGAMITFSCNPGYLQTGASMIYCDAISWNGTAPTCTIPTLNPKVSCDFEGEDLCGWSHDNNHDFEWKQNKFGTPSGHVGTGPSFDHTLGYGQAGHYMYLEASSPRKEGDIARLFSPVYPTVLSASCFIFWYHMLGESTGSLRVYVKGEDQVLSELIPSWSKEREQGVKWLQGQFTVPPLTTSFQIVIEGVRGSDYIGDSAFDDVTLQPGPCPPSPNQTLDQQGSCSIIGCNTLNTEAPGCSCNSDCRETNSCCSDFWKICNQGNSTNTSAGEENVPSKPEAVTTSTQETVITDTSVDLQDVTLQKVTTTDYTTVPMGPEVITNTPGSILTSATTNTPELVASTTGDTATATFPTSSTIQTPIVLSQNQTEDCLIDMNNTSPDWVITVYNCSTPSTVKTELTTAIPVTTIAVTEPITILPDTKSTSSTNIPPTLLVTETTPVAQYIANSSRTLYTIMTTSTPKFSDPTIAYPTTAYPPTTKKRLIPTSSSPRMTTAGSTKSSTSTSNQPPTRTTRPIPVISRVPPGLRNKTSVTVPRKISTPRKTYMSTTSSYVATKAILRTTTQKTIASAASDGVAVVDKFTDETQRSTSIPGPTMPVTNSQLFPDDSDSDEDYKQNNEDISDATSDPSYSRWREFPRRPYPAKVKESVNMSLVAVGSILGVLAVVASSLVAFYIFSRKRKPKQRSLAADSEMRFLPENDEVEISFVDPSETTRLK